MVGAEPDQLLGLRPGDRDADRARRRRPGPRGVLRRRCARARDDHRVGARRPARLPQFGRRHRDPDRLRRSRRRYARHRRTVPGPRRRQGVLLLAARHPVDPGLGRPPLHRAAHPARARPPHDRLVVRRSVRRGPLAAHRLRPRLVGRHPRRGRQPFVDRAQRRLSRRTPRQAHRPAPHHDRPQRLGVRRRPRAHFAQAQAGGAKILTEIHHYGYTSYEAEDLEGHHWTFAQARPTMA